MTQESIEKNLLENLFIIILIYCFLGKLQFSSVQSLSHVWLFVTPWIAARQASLSITNSRIHSDSRPSSPWCHPAISSSVVPFSSCPQSLPASESFPVSHLFTWGGQSTGVSPLASFILKKSQGWSPSEWTGWISLQSKGLSRVFFNTTVQKHQFFGAQLYSPTLASIHQFSSVQFSCSVVSNSLRPDESQHARPPCSSPSPRVHYWKKS